MKYFKQCLRNLAPSERTKYLAETPVYKQPVRIVKDLSSFGGADNLEMFRLTDSAVDREGDIILSAGVDTTQWEQFGSVIWGHNPMDPSYVLGAPQEVIRSDTSIDAILRFASQDENPTGAMVLRMIRSGLVQGGSVGIVIHEWTEAKDRAGMFPMNIVRSELLEFSITPIPANPRAVRQAMLSEDDQKEVIRIVEDCADSCFVSEEEKTFALECLKELNGQRTTSVPAASAGESVAAFLTRLAKGE